jgi:glycosyltransferase involved in cell wall biosynthesis
MTLGLLFITLYLKISLTKKIPTSFFDTKSCSISRGGFNCEITAYRLKSQVGPSEARNLAIHNFLNVTDFYAILDADDEYYRNKVSELVNTALHSPNIGVVYGDYDILNVDTGNTVREYKYPFSLKKTSRGVYCTFRGFS